MRINRIKNPCIQLSVISLCLFLLNACATHRAEQVARYDRQRRELAMQFVQEHTINNKKLMESTDPDIQAKRQKDLMETAADPERAKAFVMERAMINCLRDSLQVQ